MSGWTIRSEQGIHLALSCRLDLEVRDFACGDGLVAAQGAGEDGGVAVVVGKAGFGHASVGVGIAVAAAVQAGVVLADVDRLLHGGAPEASDARKLPKGLTAQTLRTYLDQMGYQFHESDLTTWRFLAARKAGKVN